MWLLVCGTCSARKRKPFYEPRTPRINCHFLPAVACCTLKKKAGKNERRECRNIQFNDAEKDERLRRPSTGFHSLFLRHESLQSRHIRCVPTRPARPLPALLPDLRRYRLLQPVYMLCSLMYFPSTFRCATQCPGITGSFTAMELFLLQRTVRAVCSPGALACVACKPSASDSD